ncbi:hypothetical protein [Fontivita pretiosa]|uniref:hypothetical protein n=1 Tax=Fontivita pretiosa TaxID=2989684 RepID=UPI003D16EBCB
MRQPTTIRAIVPINSAGLLLHRLEFHAAVRLISRFKRGTIELWTLEVEPGHVPASWHEQIITLVPDSRGPGLQFQWLQPPSEAQ